MHALPVRVVDGVADLAGEVERARCRSSAPFARDDVLERLARHVLHHDEEDVVLLLRRDDGDDVGVVDAGEQPRLAQQLAEVEALPVRNLDRDLLVDPGVFREVDGAEAAAAERGDDAVLAERLASEEQWWMPRPADPVAPGFGYRARVGGDVGMRAGELRPRSPRAASRAIAWQYSANADEAVARASAVSRAGPRSCFGRSAPATG